MSLEKMDDNMKENQILSEGRNGSEEAEWGTKERARTEREKIEEREKEAKEAAEENKKVSIVFRIMDKFGELFWLNIIFVICCLPIITIGASVTALFSVTLKMARKEDGIASKDFFHAFKSNFKQATLAWILILLVIITMVYQYMIIMSGGVSAGNVLTIILGLEMVVLSFTLPIFFPLMARFQNSLGRLFLNSFVLSISHLKQWAVAFFPWVIPAIFAYFQPLLFAYIWYFWLLILTALTAYGISITLTKVFTELELQEADRKDGKNK